MFCSSLKSDMYWFLSGLNDSALESAEEGNNLQASPLAEWTVHPWPLTAAITRATQGALIPELAGIVADYLYSPYDMFGSEDWNSLFGRVDLAPTPPPELEELLQSKCPFFEGKTVKESHWLVYIPKTVDDKPLTLNTMEEFAKNPKSNINHKSQLRQRWEGDIVREVHGDSNESSCWVLITRHVIPNSRYKSYSKQQALIESSARDWQVPSLRDAIVCVFAKYAKSGERMVSDKPWTFTRCREQARDRQALIGGFDSTGLYVGLSRYEDFKFGILAVRKISS